MKIEKVIINGYVISFILQTKNLGCIEIRDSNLYSDEDEREKRKEFGTFIIPNMNKKDFKIIKKSLLKLLK